MLYCLFWFRVGKREYTVLEIKLDLNIFVEAQDIKTPRQILENLLSAEEQIDMSTKTEIPELQGNLSHGIQVESVLFTV